MAIVLQYIIISNQYIYTLNLHNMSNIFQFKKRKLRLLFLEAAAFELNLETGMHFIEERRGAFLSMETETV